jgi:hypothetical protein
LEARLWQAFRLGLRELNWVEGVNIHIESRWVEGDAARLPDRAADLVRLKPDLIVTRGSLFTGALRAATSLPEPGDPDGRWDGSAQELEPLGAQLGPKRGQSCDVAARSDQARDMARPDRVRMSDEDDGNHAGTPSHVPGLEALAESAVR